MLNFLGWLSKNSQILNFMKIRQVKWELFHADEWTDTDTDGQSLFRSCVQGLKGVKIVCVF